MITLRCRLAVSFFVLIAGMNVPPTRCLAEDSTLPPVIQYSLFLGTLDRLEPQSITVALEEYIGRFSDAEEKDAAEAHRLFRAFYSETAHRLSESVLGYGEMLSGKDLDKRKTGAGDYRRYGLSICADEVGYFFKEDKMFLIRAAAVTTGDYGDYARYMAEEGDDRVFVEGGLTIPWDSLRLRIINLEAFARTHPGLSETDSVIRPMLKRCLAFYLRGGINTHAYDRAGAIDPELHASYERFLEDNRESSYHNLIGRVYDVLEKNGFMKCDELAALLESEEMGGMIHYQPMY